MKRIFRTRTFTRWMHKSDISDTALCKAVSEIENGLIDADLGGYILKKRLAVCSQGKRGGARVIIATQLNDRWFFLYGFDKNERSNINKNELKIFQALANTFLMLDDKELAAAINAKEIIEVIHENHNR